MMEPWRAPRAPRPARPVAVTTGLIIGRFCPPHLGHSHLIRTAAGQVDQLVVFVNTRATEPIPGDLRAGWLADLHPDVVVVEVRHDLDTDFDDPVLWDRWMALFRGTGRWPTARRGLLVARATAASWPGASAPRAWPSIRTAAPCRSARPRSARRRSTTWTSSPRRCGTWVEAWARQRPATEG